MSLLCTIGPVHQSSSQVCLEKKYLFVLYNIFSGSRWKLRFLRFSDFLPNNFGIRSLVIWYLKELLVIIQVWLYRSLRIFENLSKNKNHLTLKICIFCISNKFLWDFNWWTSKQSSWIVYENWNLLYVYFHFFILCKQKGINFLCQFYDKHSLYNCQVVKV